MCNFALCTTYSSKVFGDICKIGFRFICKVVDTETCIFVEDEYCFGVGRWCTIEAKDLSCGIGGPGI